MKKYVKPELFYESFELTQQIAACDYDSKGSMNNEGCSFIGTNKDFNEQMIILLSKPTCEDIYESYCYHNAATSTIGIFNS